MSKNIFWSPMFAIVLKLLKIEDFFSFFWLHWDAYSRLIKNFSICSLFESQRDLMACLLIDLHAFSTIFTNSCLLSSSRLWRLSNAKLCFAAAHTLSILLKGLLWAGRNTGKNSCSRNYLFFLAICAPWLSMINTGRRLPLYSHLTSISTFSRNYLNSIAFVDVPYTKTALLFKELEIAP
jgi:hypothetical protein